MSKFLLKFGLIFFATALILGGNFPIAKAQTSATASDACTTIGLYLINFQTGAVVTTSPRIKLSDATKYGLLTRIETKFGCTLGKYTLKGQTYEGPNGTNTTPQETFYFFRNQNVPSPYWEIPRQFGKPANPYMYIYTLDVNNSVVSNLSVQLRVYFTDDKGNTGSTPGTGGNGNSNSGNNTGNSNSNTPPNTSTPNNQIDTGTDFTFNVNLDQPIGVFDNLINPGSVPELIVSLIRILFILVGIAAVIVIIIAGFRMVIDSGNEIQMKKAKEAITWAIIGLIISILAFSIVAIIQRIIIT